MSAGPMDPYIDKNHKRQNRKNTGPGPMDPRIYVGRPSITHKPDVCQCDLVRLAVWEHSATYCDLPYEDRVRLSAAKR